MPILTQSYAGFSETTPLRPFAFERRDPGPLDVQIEILYCGICHSDIHTVRGEWGPVKYPLVPGHEIVGRVSAVGKKVKKFKVGESVGVGCFVDSCGKCENCKDYEQQFCSSCVYTYNSVERDGKTQAQGGYSSVIVVNQDYVLKVAKKLDLARVAPLLCAGITTYSPLKRAKIKKGMRVGIVGLGGLGHMGVKFAKAFGAHVTVFSTSPQKEADAKKFGAKSFVVSKDQAALGKCRGSFDVILDTVSADHDINSLMGCLKKGGQYIVVGVPPEGLKVSSLSLIMGRKNLSGSLIGGTKELQQMLDFCAKKKILADIELIQADKINEAYERTIKSDVKYRFVIDCKTL